MKPNKCVMLDSQTFGALGRRTPDRELCSFDLLARDGLAAEKIVSSIARVRQCRVHRAVVQDPVIAVLDFRSWTADCVDKSRRLSHTDVEEKYIQVMKRNPKRYIKLHYLNQLNV